MPSPSLGAATIVEILERFERAGGDLSRLVVIGGSAGLHWHLAISEHTAAGSRDFLEEAPLQTSDLDFQLAGDNHPLALIQQFAAAVGGRVIRPTPDDNTPEIAVVIVDGFFEEGESLKIDFLPQTHGVDAQAVFAHAQPLISDEDKEVLFLHPVHLLLGTVANYIDLPSRRHSETLRRIDQLIGLVRRYIVAQAQSGTPDGEADARWTMQTLLRTAATPKHARFTLDHQRDILDAIPRPADAPVKEGFWREECPREHDKVYERRDRVVRRRANSGHSA